MRFLKRPLILHFLIVLTLLGAGWFSYKAYNGYQEFKSTKPGVTLPLFLKTLSSFSDAVDQELLESTAYILKKNRSSLKRMLQAREKSDDVLHRLYAQIDAERMFHLLREDAESLSKVLENARKTTDTLPSDIMQSLFEAYFLNVSMPLSKMVTRLAMMPALHQESKMLLLYQKVLALKARTAFENSMVYMVLLRNKPLQPKEKLILEQLIGKDTLPTFERFVDAQTSAELQILVSQEQYDAYLSDMRQTILQEGVRGNYSVDVVVWLEKVKQKNEALKKLETDLLKKLERLSADDYTASVFPVVLYAVLALLLWFVLFKLLALRTREANNAKLSDATLKEIELVFAPEEQKRLKHLVAQGNVDHIYKFLLQAIKDANHTKDLFLANMSHEIRTPLNGIVGFTQLLQETQTTDEQKEFLTIVAKSSEHLLKIVNDILDLAKIKAQKIEFESIAFDPLVEFESAIESYAGKAYKENIDLNVFIDPHLPTAMLGDPTKISQILVNLISNAIKFTSKNGEVNVTIEQRSESAKEVEIYFAVSDTGIGITKEQRKKIFQAFSQADVSTSRKYGGTGLGLSISGKLIELMGGKLGIRSIPDEGSTFYFTLKFPKIKEAKPRAFERLDGMQVGILDPHIDEKYYLNKNLASYLAYMGATVTHYTDRSIMRAKEQGVLPEILFIDHKYRQRGGEIEPYLDLACRIMLLTTGDQKRSLERYASRIEKIIYKPVTFLKTNKALSQKHEESESKQEVHFEEIRILVAEDNAINQKLICNVLERIGIDVTIANNGEEAFNMRKEQHFDMIFMDIQMPVMGGMEATAKILGYERAEHKKHIPIIALTANALTGDKAKYLGAGMDGYLSKPIQLEALKELFLTYFSDRLKEERVA